MDAELDAVIVRDNDNVSEKVRESLVVMVDVHDGDDDCDCVRLVEDVQVREEDSECEIV
jgi:hypothetical protein